MECRYGAGGCGSHSRRSVCAYAYGEGESKSTPPLLVSWQQHLQAHLTTAPLLFMLRLRAGTNFESVALNSARQRIWVGSYMGTWMVRGCYSPPACCRLPVLEVHQALDRCTLLDPLTQLRLRGPRRGVGRAGLHHTARWPRSQSSERRCTRTGSTPGWLRQVGLMRHDSGHASASRTTRSLNAAE